MSTVGTALPYEDAVPEAAAHLRDVLEHAIQHTADRAALVVSDGRSPLARTLREAYLCCLPGAVFLDFDSTPPEAIRAAFELLAPRDLVVLIQSTSFRLDAFRIRIELFNRSLAVIEHPHLARMEGPEARIYVSSLAYDPTYYRGVGHSLKASIDAAARCEIVSSDGSLVFPAALEPAKVNIGDYRGLKSVGGQFPIGEVFTESRELEAVFGRVAIAFFGDTNFTVNRPPRPITLEVDAGRVTGAHDSTPAFDAVLAEIREAEGEVWVRELGFGLNRAFSAARTVTDIGTFERMCGVHLSLGAKHASYSKPGISKRTARFHVDVFVDTRAVLLDGVTVYRDGAWIVADGAAQ